MTQDEREDIWTREYRSCARLLFERLQRLKVEYAESESEAWCETLRCRIEAVAWSVQGIEERTPGTLGDAIDGADSFRLADPDYVSPFSKSQPP